MIKYHVAFLYYTSDCLPSTYFVHLNNIYSQLNLLLQRGWM